MEGAEDEDGFCTSKRCPPGPSAVPLGSAHADAKQKRITIIDRLASPSPVIIHSSPRRPQTPPASHHFTSNNTSWASEHVSSSSKPTLFYSGLIQHRLRYLPLLEHRASHSFERIKSSIIERDTQRLESHQNYRNFPVQSSLRLNTF